MTRAAETLHVTQPTLSKQLKALDDQIRTALGDAADNVCVFHLRGSIRWQSLGLVERMMMGAMIADIRKKKEEERTLIERQLLEAEGGAIDFSDEADLSPIVHAARFGKGDIRA